MVMDVNERIRELIAARGWTEYRIARESGLSNSTIANLFHRNTVPSITTLEAICNGLGITLAQFFSEDNAVVLTADQQQLFKKWLYLSGKQKQVIFELIDLIYESGK